ncbi:hypothetical protein RB595_008813 [Gaeumannomyces hyphopodioides]
MRLINVQTMQLEEFMVDPPPYAILSHTWGAEEVTFADFNHADPLVRERKAGWRKIENTCRLSREDQYSYQYAWIDTCCIDKSSSAELSEAINSMYAWYAGSQVCYAYLEDVPPQTPNLDSSDDWFSSRPQLWAWETYDFGVKSAFAGSRWFRRGWTLQELVAPGRVHFYDQKWGPIASRRQIPPDLSLITGIPQAVLQGGANILHYPVGARISWAADRQTTRPEDLAYSLLGLLDINMPLLYGEGSRAFLRLQEEILRQHEDDTLFLWCSPPADPWALRGMLANSPSDFANFREEAYYSFRGIKPSFTLDMGKIEPVSAFSSPQSSSGVDNRGVSFTGYIVDIRPEYSTGGTAMLHLNCRLNSADWVCLYLEQLGPNRYARARPSEVFIVDENEYDHSDGGEKTIIVYKTDDVIRNLVSNNRLAFLDKFYGPENKSLLYQYLPLQRTCCRSPQVGGAYCFEDVSGPWASCGHRGPGNHIQSASYDDLMGALCRRRSLHNSRKHEVLERRRRAILCCLFQPSTNSQQWQSRSRPRNGNPSLSAIMDRAPLHQRLEDRPETVLENGAGLGSRRNDCCSGRGNR